MSVVETPPTAPLRAVVSLDALRANLALVRRKLATGTELIACVKANAYALLFLSSREPAMCVRRD